MRTNQRSEAGRLWSIGFLLTLFTIILSPVSWTQTEVLEVAPFREEEFVGELETGDFYKMCRLDPNGNIYTVSKKGILQKFAVDGGPEFRIPVKGTDGLPVSIYDISIALDATVYVIGIEEGSGKKAVIYKISPGETTPTLIETARELQVCKCAVARDMALHVISFETLLPNEVLAGTFRPSKTLQYDSASESIPDVAIRRFDFTRRGSGTGYRRINIPANREGIDEVIKDICRFRILSADGAGRTHLLNMRTGMYESYSEDGTLLSERELEPRENLEGKAIIFRAFWLSGRYAVYQVVSMDANGYVKSNHVRVLDEETKRRSTLKFKTGDESYFEVDSHPAADHIIQTTSIGNRIVTRRYRITDVIK